MARTIATRTVGRVNPAVMVTNRSRVTASSSGRRTEAMPP